VRRGVASGWGTMVSGGGRHATSGACAIIEAADWPASVVCGARGACDPACAGLWRSGDWPPTGGCKPKPPEILPITNFPDFDGWCDCQLGLERASGLGWVSPTFRILTQIRKVRSTAARLLWRCNNPTPENACRNFRRFGLTSPNALLDETGIHRASPQRAVMGAKMKLHLRPFESQSPAK